MAYQKSTEFEVFREKRRIIRTGILNSCREVASEAYARDLIPPEVHRNVTGLARLTSDERVDSLLDELEARIANDPSVLEKFVTVLKTVNAAFYKVVIDTISKT